jgi:hypothetical protein
MPRSRASAAALAASLSLAVPALAHAHAVCGDRVFPATLTMDDPGFNDELSLPTIQYAPIPSSGGNPSGSTTSYGFEWDKTIVPNAGIAINDDYIIQRGAGQNLSGWDDLTLTVKGQLPCWESHEFMVSLGVIHQFGGTGSGQLRSAGAIASVGDTAPTIYVGKGLGDLPFDYLRPLAVTGQFSYQFSDTAHVTPNQWNYAASLQYSMPYLQQHVKALDMPDFFNHLIPLVEFVYAKPQAGGATTGTISPGIFYEGDTWQVGAEAVIPANGASRLTRGTGFIVQFHLFLDDVFPNSLGKPLFEF